MCCSVLAETHYIPRQHTANTCSLGGYRQGFPSSCNTLQHTATHCKYLQFFTCNTLQHTATHGNTRQHTATHCNTLQILAALAATNKGSLPTATHCNTLQHTAHTCGFSPAIYCNTLQHMTTQCKYLQRWQLRTRGHFQLQHTATYCNTLQHTATHCKYLQFFTCNTLQHTETHCNTLRIPATLAATNKGSLPTASSRSNLSNVSSTPRILQFFLRSRLHSHFR